MAHDFNIGSSVGPPFKSDETVKLGTIREVLYLNSSRCCLYFGQCSKKWSIVSGVFEQYGQLEFGAIPILCRCWLRHVWPILNRINAVSTLRFALNVQGVGLLSVLHEPRWVDGRKA